MASNIDEYEVPSSPPEASMIAAVKTGPKKSTTPPAALPDVSNDQVPARVAKRPRGLPKFDQNAPNKWATQLPPPDAKAVKSDLAEFGFPAKKVRLMIGKEEKVPVDGFAQPPNNYAAIKRAEKEEWVYDPRDAPGARDKRVKKREYEHLHLVEGSSKLHHFDAHGTSHNDDGVDWVLFDHLRGYPPDLGTPPSVISKHAQYLPGHKRIVEYNLSSQSLRTSTTPETWAGKTIEYTLEGPKFVEVVPEEAEEVPVKRRPGRPRKIVRAIRTLNSSDVSSESETSEDDRIEVKRVKRDSAVAE